MEVLDPHSSFVAHESGNSRDQLSTVYDALVPRVPPMAAVANAISHAVGVRTNRLPMNPGSVLEALWEKQSNGT